MISQKSSPWMVLLAMLTVGCAAQSQARSGQQAARAVPTLAAVGATCRELSRRGTPCVEDYGASPASLLVHFESAGSVERDEPAITRNLGLAFCEATRTRGVAAVYVVELHGYGQRQLDCQRSEWSDWKRPAALTFLDGKTLSDACSALTQSAVPARCVLTRSDGLPKLSLIARSQHSFSLYADELLRRLAMPFCQVANASGSGGVVQIVVPTEYKLRTLMCETGQDSSWISYEPKDAVTESARTPRSEQRASMGRSL